MLPLRSGMAAHPKILFLNYRAAGGRKYCRCAAGWLRHPKNSIFKLSSGESRMCLPLRGKHMQAPTGKEKMQPLLPCNRKFIRFFAAS